MKSYDVMNSAHNNITWYQQEMNLGLWVVGYDTIGRPEIREETRFTLYKIESLQKYKKYTR